MRSERPYGHDSKRAVVLVSIVARDAATSDARWVPPALCDLEAMNHGFRGACYERLFWMLHEHFGVSYEDFRHIARNTNGKPVMPPWRQNIHFNVSHADNYGLVAMSRVEVGVDIEEVVACYEKTLQDFLPPSSCLRMGATPFAAWVRYEAIAKLLGIGLCLDVDAVHANDAQMLARMLPVWVCELSLPNGPVAAVASHHPVDLITWKKAVPDKRSAVNYTNPEYSTFKVTVGTDAASMGR